VVALPVAELVELELVELELVELVVELVELSVATPAVP
jgi:hypothetical protein